MENIKCVNQKGKWVASDRRDVWDLDCTLSPIILAGLVKFKEDDLIFAATYLPTPTEAEYGKFSQGLANMLLIRLYLHESPENKEYYTKIEEIARKLMAPSYGYRLSTSYTQMFEIGGQGKR